MRRQIAQLATVIRERQLADGIDRKTSRKLEKEANLEQGFGRF